MERRATPFPPGFFNRVDDRPDDDFYEPLRLVTHIDQGAIAAVGDLYEALDLTGDVLDLMSSWISHFRSAPGSLTLLGMNAAELAHNEMADAAVVHDLNTDPSLPFGDDEFDAVTCCVSVDYLVRPIEVFTDVARVLRPGGRFVVTFSNRCFPTKAIRGVARQRRQRPPCDRALLLRAVGRVRRADVVPLKPGCAAHLVEQRGLVGGAQLIAGTQCVRIGARDAEVELAQFVDHRRDELGASVAKQFGADP